MPGILRPPRSYLLNMSEKAFEALAQTSDTDAIAARELAEDKRIKTEQQRSGGALEVFHPHPHNSP
jgi:hypothetical protein